MATPLNILIVEDSADDTALIVDALQSAGFDPQWSRVETEAAFLDEIKKLPDIILSDYSMPHFSGLRCAKILQESGLNIPFILISGTVGEDVAVEAMKNGATDYLLKDRIGRLGNAVERALKEKRLRDERRRLEQRLALQATALETAANGIIITDFVGKILWANPAFKTVTGYDIAEAIGKTPRILKSGKHNREFYQDFWKTIKSGKTWRGEFINRRKDGSIYYDEHTVTPVCSQDGKITHFVGIMNDLTERKKAEKSLNFSRLLVDHSNDGIEVIDPETGRFLDINETTCRRLGYTRDELLTMTVMDLDNISVNPATWPRIVEEIRHAEFKIVEGRHRRKDGSTFPIEANVRYIALDRDYLIAVVRDITERKRAEEELRESEIKFRQLVENIHEVLWITDPKKNQMIYISPAYEKIWGRTCETLYESPRTWLDAIHPDDRERVLHAAVTKQELGTYDETYRIIRSDGSHRWIRDRAFPVRDTANEVHRIVGVAEDITERRNAEHVALRSQRLESIGTLAGGVAHDLNNALAPIMMGVEILKMQYPGESKIMDMFQASAKRGAEMVRQLLTFAKGAEGERMSIQPGHLIKEMQKMMKGSFPKNIQLSSKCSSTLPTVLGDATQLHQVLLNLCVNARDAMPHGGTLTLEATEIEVDAAYASAVVEAKPGRYVLLRVRDTGTGIPPEILDRIFDPFFTTKGPEKGTGLGLATALGIVKGHGGFFHVYSKPGHGSTFNVYLPAEQVPGRAESISKVEVEFHGNGETILLVDDEVAMREMARVVLRRLNFTPLTAADGADGLIKAAENRTELRAIITDLHMPHMDGLNFIRTLRRMLPNIPIMVASGQMDESMVGEFKNLGVLERLDKPFTEAQLAEGLKKLLAPN